MSSGSVTQWLSGLARGEEKARAAIIERYFEQLVALARRRLGNARRGASDEEDAALSAMNALMSGAEDGRFPSLDDREGLWKLLATILRNKVLDHLKREGRQRRGGGGVCGESAFAQGAGSEAEAGINLVPDREPTPEETAMFVEECQRLLDLLEPQLRQVAVWKSEGHTQEEIAEKLGCSLRTVKRHFESIRDLWSREAEGYE